MFMLSFACIFTCVIFCFASCTNNKETVVIEEPTKLLKNPTPYNYPSTNPYENEIIAVLSSGDKGVVLGCEYGKDFKAYKVQMQDGKTGYLISGGDFKVLGNK